MVRVLLIDDDDRQSERLTALLRQWGWSAARAGSEPDTALARLRAEPFDLALLALDAAERDDHALLRRRRAESLPTPVVITAHNGVALARLARCVEFGASDYITHPQQAVLFRARLDNVLQRKLLEEQASTALESFNEIEKIADDLRLVILPLGAALSAEPDLDRLTARIVEEAQTICTADGGLLYLLHDDGLLHASYLSIRSIGVARHEAARDDDSEWALPPLSLVDDEGASDDNLPTFVALAGESVNLANVRAGRFGTRRLDAFERAHGYRVVSCLAVPLRSGQVVGALLLINCLGPTGAPDAHAPFDAYHQLVAESLASQAAVVLNNRLLSQREGALLRFKRELEIGREIQLSFLPARLPNPPGWELVSRFRPALEVAGDFFDAFLLPHGYLALVTADVVGKGVTAALFMAIIRTLFRALFQQNYFHAEAEQATAATPRLATTTPFSFVDRAALLNAVRLTNAYLIGNHADTSPFATLWAALLDPDTGRLLYVNAGHNPPLVLGRPRGERLVRERLRTTGPAIGLIAHAGYWLAETRLTADDLLFVYTDGVTEARNATGDELGLERVEALLAAAGTAEDALWAIETALREHTAGLEAFDDVTMLALRRLTDEQSG